MEKLKSMITGKQRYPFLTTLAKVLLTIPKLNADPEQVRKIVTDQRADLKAQTVESLLLCKVS